MTRPTHTSRTTRDPGMARSWISSAAAVALTALVANAASAWVITEEESLRALARAGAPIVFPPPTPARGPGVYVLHEAEGLCPADAATANVDAKDNAVSCQRIEAADGVRRDRLSIDVDRAIAIAGPLASELARAIDAIDPRRGDRLASLAATTILPSIPFQPPDTGGTEWTEIAFGITGPVDLRGPAPAKQDFWSIGKRLAKTMMLPAIAIMVTLVLLWLGLRRLRQRADLMAAAPPPAYTNGP